MIKKKYLFMFHLKRKRTLKNIYKYIYIYIKSTSKNIYKYIYNILGIWQKHMVHNHFFKIHGPFGALIQKLCVPHNWQSRRFFPNKATSPILLSRFSQIGVSQNGGMNWSANSQNGCPHGPGTGVKTTNLKRTNEQYPISFFLTLEENLKMWNFRSTQKQSHPNQTFLLPPQSIPNKSSQFARSYYEEIFFFQGISLLELLVFLFELFFFSTLCDSLSYTSRKRSKLRTLFESGIKMGSSKKTSAKVGRIKKQTDKIRVYNFSSHLQIRDKIVVFQNLFTIYKHDPKFWLWSLLGRHGPKFLKTSHPKNKNIMWADYAYAPINDFCSSLFLEQILQWTISYTSAGNVLLLFIYHPFHSPIILVPFANLKISLWSKNKNKNLFFFSFWCKSSNFREPCEKRSQELENSFGTFQVGGIVTWDGNKCNGIIGIENLTAVTRLSLGSQALHDLKGFRRVGAVWGLVSN
ncbi:hypothetical protein VP01_1111g5 [Puccinia sorghi]|uniref:Uncharacterized protein n=1 Tax=Puccinia sorghi TaxID=27349 RepID=A0A0L6VSM1_9BASI|nr:hypothetical protein VP01_1111g5 [Puccinia sorghi]